MVKIVYDKKCTWLKNILKIKPSERIETGTGITGVKQGVLKALSPVFILKPLTLNYYNTLEIPAKERSHNLDIFYHVNSRNLNKKNSQDLNKKNRRDLNKKNKLFLQYLY